MEADQTTNIVPLRTGVFIGRFQPFHTAHLDMVNKALDAFHRLIVVIGSANAPRSYRNPFLSHERRHMISETLAGNVNAQTARFLVEEEGLVYDEYRNRLDFVAQEDMPGNNVGWVHSIAEKVWALDSSSMNDEYVITGRKKDETTFYVDIFPWEFEPLPWEYNLNATDIRRSYFSGEGIEKWGHSLPRPVAEFMWMFKGGYAFKRIQEEMKNGQGI